METSKFGVMEAVGYGLRTFIDHFMLLFGSIIVAASIYYLIKISWLIFLTSFLFSNISTTIIDAFAWGKIDFSSFRLIPPMFYILYFLGSLFLLLIYYGLMAGMIKLLFNVHDKNTGSINDLFSRFYLAPRMWATAILYGLIVGVGLIFLVVPGIYLAMRFALYPYFIVDTESGIMNSLGKSYSATINHALKLFGVLIIIFFFNFIPLIGPILEGFVTPIVLVYIYRKLTVKPPIAVQSEASTTTQA